MIVLRTQNAAALVTGRWAEWSLLPEGDSTRLRTPNYFPFLADKYLPPAVRNALRIGWFVSLAAAVLLNLWLFARLSRDLRAFARTPSGSWRREGEGAF
jgi:hypothetical protein